MPPKGKKAKTRNDAKYMFVNEDANTVLSNTRDAELDRSKQSHVQRRQFARKRDQVANAAGAQSSTALGPPTAVQGLDTLSLASPQGPPGGLLSSSDYFNLFDASTVGDDLLAAPPGSSLYGDLFFDHPQADLFTTVSQPPSPLFATDRQTSAYALSQPFRRGSSRSRGSRDERPTSRRSRAASSIPHSTSPTPPVDPFSSTFLALEIWAPPLLQYYTTVVIPHLFATELKTVPMQLMRHTPALHADMQTCMAEAAHMYAFLAAVSARMLRYEGRLLLPDVKSEDNARVPLFFKTKAITSLRQKLERGQLDRLLAQDVYRLMATAVMLDDKPTADAHFLALTEMIRNLGGLDIFDAYIKERMILLHIWRSCWTLGKPQLPLSWDPGHLADDFRAEIQSDEYTLALGSGFDGSETSNILSQELLNLISSLTEVVDLTRYSFAHPLASNNFQWLLLRRTAIEYRLLSSMSDTTDDNNTIAQSTKLTTLIWIGMVLVERYKQLLAHQVHVLRTRLEDEDTAGFETSHTALLLWIATTCALATIDHEDKDWSIGLAGRMARKLEIETVQDMEEQLHGYLYMPEMQREALKALMESFAEDEKGKGKIAASENG